MQGTRQSLGRAVLVRIMWHRLSESCFHAKQLLLAPGGFQVHWQSLISGQTAVC